MKKSLKFIGKSLVAGMFFSIGVVLIYAASTVINSLTNQTINNGDKIGSGWFQDVNDNLNNLTNNIFISGSNVGIGNISPSSKLDVSGDIELNGNNINGYTPNNISVYAAANGDSVSTNYNSSWVNKDWCSMKRVKILEGGSWPGDSISCEIQYDSGKRRITAHEVGDINAMKCKMICFDF